MQRVFFTVLSFDLDALRKACYLLIHKLHFQELSLFIYQLHLKLNTHTHTSEQNFYLLYMSAYFSNHIKPICVVILWKMV